MNMNKRNILLFFFLQIFLFAGLRAQDGSIEGTIYNKNSQKPVAEASIKIISTQLETSSDSDGKFSFEGLDAGTYIFQITARGYLAEYRTIDLDAGEHYNFGDIYIIADDRDITVSAGTDAQQFVTVSGDDMLGNDQQGIQNTAALLSASKDVFLSATAYNFSAFRFDVRGLESKYNTLLLNGVNINDPASGNVYWSLWGGLNDMFRFRQVDMDMGAKDFAMGSINGASMIDLRASQQYKQTRVSYAMSNRSYRNRIMLTHSTGLLKNGWAFAFSGSRRWAQSGYNPGTPYDAYAYFVGIEKVFNKKHAIGLTVLGAPRWYGKSSPSVQEAKDLAGTNFYNSYWGYQDGKVRNSRIRHTNEPIGILRYDFTPDEKTHLRVSAYMQKGTNGSTALNWFNDTSDPRPTYYRKLPSYSDNPEVAAAKAHAWRTNTDISQIDWEKLYEINSLSTLTIENANGSGTSYTGNFARYLVEDRRYDGTQYGLNAVYNKILNPHFQWTVGANYNYALDHNYKIAKDLLGADFYVNVDKFALRDSSENKTFIQNNLAVPNQIIYEGDKFGYEYNTIVHRARVWSQGQYTMGKLALHLSGALTSTRFWRDGLVRNGKFPENSYGKSDIASFLDYSVKTGIRYAFNGRHFLYANGMIATQAPYLRNSFTSIRTRDQLIPGLEQEKILAGEAGYIIRSPYVKFRFSAYAIQFKDQSETRSFFLDEDGRSTFDNIVSRGYVNLTMTGINKRHAGLEAAIDVQILPGLSIKSAGAIGEYIYTSRPKVSAILDNNQTYIIKDETAYLKGFYVSGTPQTVFNIGLNYDAPHYWFASLTWNYYNRTYLDFFPLRRTQLAVKGAQPGTDLWNEIINQEKAPSGFTLDFFGGKSFKLENYYLYFLVGVNNILNNTDLITGGFEQYRYRIVEDAYSQTPDPHEFPRNYFYAYGLNYYISLTLRI